MLKILLFASICFTFAHLNIATVGEDLIEEATGKCEQLYYESYLFILQIEVALMLSNSKILFM